MCCTVFRLLAVVGGVGGLLWAIGSNPTALPAASAAPQYVVSGPYTHDNLSVFLLHGPDTLPARPVKSLDEALAAGTAVVHDDQSVNTLVVENLSESDDLMMQNGDILKGGRQDRVLRTAMILPPKSGRVAVEAFCVESGRWQQRGTEAATRFAANPGQIAGRALKHAVNTSGVQTEVWKNVAEQQAALTAKVGKAVNGAASPTSLQLALEDKELQAKLNGYRAALANVLAGKLRPIGFALAVNGKVTGAEVFGSGVLLAKAWPKALGAAAVEALTEKQDGGAAFVTATEDSVNAFLADAAKPQANEVARAERRGRNANAVWGGWGTSIELVREANAIPSTLSSADDPIGDPNTDTRVIQDSLTAIGNPTDNLIDPGQRVGGNANAALGGGSRSRDRLVQSNGGQQGINTANPTLGGRSAATHTRLVTGQGGRGQQQEAFNLSALNAAEPQGQFLEAAPVAAPSRAVPVVVNRTAGQNGVMVESRDRANPGVVIHRTFIAK